MNRHLVISLVVAIIFAVSAILAITKTDTVQAALFGVGAIIFAMRAASVANRSKTAVEP